MENENLTAGLHGCTSSDAYQPDGRDFISEREITATMSRSLQQRQDLMDRRNTLLSSYLKETAKQAQDLRQENINLKMVNAELTRRLSLLIKATSEQASFGLSGSFMDSVLSGFSRMRLAGSDGVNGVLGGERESPSLTSVMDSGRVEGNVDRVVLPKSISVRSNGCLKPGQAGGTSRIGLEVVKNKRVYVRGGEKEDEQPLELEVYNQGMFKTELCNKWQEIGACPYGDHCQFAHGIQELRPVLRHPRYKTEVCRMVLSGDRCPYGHRCHFRHNLTDQEKLIRSISLRSFKGLHL